MADRPPWTHSSARPAVRWYVGRNKGFLEPGKREGNSAKGFRSCSRVPKLWKLVLSGWGRYLKVTLNVWPKISAHVDGGPSGGSSVLRPESEDPHPPERTL